MTAFAALYMFEMVCRRNGRHILDPSEINILADVSFVFGSAYNALAVEACQQRKRLWPFRPKFHMFDHICLDFAVQADDDDDDDDDDEDDEDDDDHDDGVGSLVVGQVVELYNVSCNYSWMVQG